MHKINQIKIGAVLSYLQIGLSVVISLIYTPVMLRLLGQSEYGLYSTVSSTIAMLSILSLGFNSSYIRYYAIYKKDNDKIAIDKLNGLFLLIFIVIGITALACGLFLTAHLDLVFDQGLTDAEYQTAKVLMLLLTVNLALSFPMSVFQSIVSAHERYVFLKLLGMLRTVVSPLLTLPLLLMGYGSIAMVVITVLVSVTVDTITLIYAKKSLQVRFVFHDFEKGLFQNMLIYTSFIALNLVVDQVNSNMGKVLLGRFNGTTSVAIYSVGYAIYQLYMTFSCSVSGVFTPRIHKIVNETSADLNEQRRSLSELFNKVGRIQFAILALICSGFVFFGQPFIALWAGKGYEQAYYVALLLMLSATVPFIQNLGIEIQRALNKHQFRSIAYIIMAFVNVILTTIFCQRFDAVGAAMGTCISLILMNGLVMNIYYHTRCNINIISFWKDILRLGAGLIPSIIFGIVVLPLFTITSFGGLLIGIAAYSVVYGVSMWVLGLNVYEKDLVRKPILRLLRKQ